MDFIFDPSLVLYLPLYQLDGASFMSRDKCGHLCTVIGALWTPQGRSFDGVDDYIDCGSPTSLDNVNPKTVEAWIYPIGWGEGSKGYVFVKAAWNFFINSSAGEETIQTWHSHSPTPGSWTTPNGSIVLGAWQHVAFTYDNSNNANDPIIYINSIIQSLTELTTPSGNPTSDADNTLYIGNNAAGARTWDGLIGEVRIYSRALTPAEIQHNYLATKWRYR